MSDPVRSSSSANAQCLPDPMSKYQSLLSTRAPSPAKDDSGNHVTTNSRGKLNVEGDRAEVSFAALEVRNSATGAQGELLSAKVTVDNEQVQGEATVARFGVASDDGKQRVEGTVMQLQGGMGTKNSDGSTGANLGVSAQLIGVEANGSLGGNSATVGASVGVGASASFGIRDQDGDGNSEICGKVSGKIGIGLTIGACLENPLSWF